MTMKLLSTPVSPLGARAEIVARVKGASLEVVHVRGAELRRPEFLALNPLGKLPVLVTENGRAIPESEAIMDYLDDRFPDPAMRPVAIEERSRHDVACRIVETYLTTPIVRLFPHVPDPGAAAQVVEQEIGHWREGLAQVELLAAAGLPTVPAGLSKADVLLATALHLGDFIAIRLGRGADLQPGGTTARWYDAMRSRPEVGPILAAVTTAQHARYL